MKNRLNLIRLTHACAHIYHAGNSSHGQLFSINWGASAWHSRRVNVRGKLVSQRPSSAKHSFKRQLHTTPVGTVGREPHCSSTTTCSGKADYGFGVCVSLTLSLSFEKSELNCSTA